MNIELYEKANNIIHKIQVCKNTIQELQKVTNVLLTNKSEDKTILVLSDYSANMNNLYKNIKENCIKEYEKKLERLQKEFRDL